MRGIQRQSQAWPRQNAPVRFTSLREFIAAKGEDLYISGLVDRVGGEFNDWWKSYEPQFIKENGFGWDDYAKVTGDTAGPLGHWPHVEKFLEQKYPAAHRGFAQGYEMAQPVLDGQSDDISRLLLRETPGYETGPDAVAKYGYDPKEIAATLLMLHSQTHPGRASDDAWLATDVERIYDIYQKRQQMERNRPKMNQVMDDAEAMGLLGDSDEAQLHFLEGMEDALNEKGKAELSRLRGLQPQQQKVAAWKVDPDYFGALHEMGHVMDAVSGFKASDSLTDMLYGLYEKATGIVMSDEPGGHHAPFRKWLREGLPGRAFEGEQDYDDLNPKEAIAAAFAEHESHPEASSDLIKAIHQHVVDHSAQAGRPTSLTTFRPRSKDGQPVPRGFLDGVQHVFTKYPQSRIVDMVEPTELSEYGMSPVTEVSFGSSWDNKPVVRYDDRASMYPDLVEDTFRDMFNRGEVSPWMWEPDTEDTVKAASRVLEAMAWDEWAPKIQHYAPGRPEGKGFYSVDHGNGITSDLSYTPNHKTKTLDIGLVGVNKRFQGDGIAEALIRRLHEDHPGYTINTGYMTPEGKGFHDRMLEKEPTAREVVTRAMRVLAAAEQSAADIITDWTKARGRRRNGPVTEECPTCRGSGSEPMLHSPCHKCDASGEVIKDKISDQVGPWANKLESKLYREFMDWWPTSVPALTRDPEHSGTRWQENPTQPISHWLNVEDFLKEKYPASATGATFGGEDARPLMDRALAGMASPAWLESNGYIGSGDAITQAFLSLHNKINGRTHRDAEDRKRYYQLMLRHVGPKAVRRSPQKAAAFVHLASGVDFSDRVRTGALMVRVAYQEALSPSPLTDDLIYGLSREFHDWAKANDRGNPYDDKYKRMPIEEFMQKAPKGWKPRGPLGHWPNVEEFLKEKYPASHRGLSFGFEDAEPLLEHDADDPDWAASHPWLKDKEPYETGPEAHAKHGYDPKEVAAALLILHNGTHQGRDNWVTRDQNRLIDIMQKRMKMQREYDERNPDVKAAMRLLAAVDRELVDRLNQEFHDWYGDDDNFLPEDDDEVFDLDDEDDRGPIGDWRNIEEFLREYYPAAYKGHQMGLEQAAPVLDGRRPIKLPQSTQDFSPYISGPEAVAEHGYDPAEIAAAFVLLHNKSHPLRDGWAINDEQRLVDIFQKRQKMQRDYEQRTKAAAVNQDLVEQLRGEFDQWWKESVPSNKNDPVYREYVNWADHERGPIGSWRNVERFLKDKYPATHRRFDMGHEQARVLLDWDTMYPHEEPGGTDRYETGSSAIEQYGYDPREVAAGMLLLHNQSDPLRGDLSQKDQDRLTDIFDKRQQMQREYDERQLQTAHQLLAATQLLLPGMPAREHQPDQGPEPEYPEGDWWRDSWYMNEPEPESEPEPEEDDTWWRDEPWMHVSPHKLEPGDVLMPRGGASPYGGKILAPGHDSNVWIDHPHKMKGWADEMGQYGAGPLYFYDVEPDERPEANVLGSELGWAVPSARILQRREDFDPDGTWAEGFRVGSYADYDDTAYWAVAWDDEDDEDEVQK